MSSAEICTINLKTHTQDFLKSGSNSTYAMESSGSASSQPLCFEEHRISDFSSLQICIPSPSTPSVITFFDGSRVSPIKEASLVLDEITIMDDGATLKENVKDQEVVSWLVPSIQNESCGTYSPKFSLFHSDLGSPLKWNKDYKWIIDKMFDIASSASSLTDSSDADSSSFSSFSSFSTDNSSEIMDLEECGIDKPLFWPCDSTPEWGSMDEWDFFIMSPRKNICILRKSPKTPPHTPRLRLLNGKMDLEKGCKRRLVFHSRSNSSTSLDLKPTNSTRCFRRMKSMPSSRFRKGTKTNVDGWKGESSEDKVLVNKTTTKPKVFLEDLLLTEKLNDEPVIETILGLEEFDGHEGIEVEFNRDEFFLEII